jgi:hypothetical protein
MRTTLILFAAAVSVVWAAAAGAVETAGVVQFVAGEVKLVSPGGAGRDARKGVPVNVGDTVRTGVGALAQLKMGDGAIVVVQPDSNLTVAEFHFDGREDGTEKVHYRLQQGGFRAVTGAIGHTHKQNYVIETPIAHMGVRGTDHETYYFPPAGEALADGAKPGAYNKVNTGRTFIRTNAGEIDVEPNEVGYVASANDVPVILPSVPSFFNRSAEPRNAHRQPSPAVTQQAVAQATRVEQPVETDDGQPLVHPRGPAGAASNGMGPLIGYSQVAGGASFGRTASGAVVVPNGASYANAGGDAAYGVNWGSWAGGMATVGGVATNGAVHVISSTQMTTPAQLAALPSSIVTATYNYAGGPAPTNQAGVQGTVNSLAVGVNFSTQQITSYALDASAGGANWSAKGSGSIAQFTGTSGIALSGNCSGCGGGGAPAASGTANGAFVGSTAQKMISAFGLTAAGQSISGTAYLSR